MATSASLAQQLLDTLYAVRQLPAAMTELERRLGRLGLAEAAVAANVVARAAEVDYANFVAVSQALESFTTAATTAARYTGTVSQGFAAAAGPEIHDVVIAAPWVTATTPEGNIKGRCINDPTAGAGDLGLLMAYCKAATIVPGVGFTLRMFKPTYCTTAAASFLFFWEGYP